MNTVKKIRSMVVIVLLMESTLYPVLAAEHEEDAFKFFEDEAKVVVASQHSQKLSEAPASAYVISAQDIERNGYQTLAEALQSLPGVYAVNDRDFSYLSVRGFGRPSDYNDRLLVLVDGHRINDEVYGGVLAGQEFSVDMKAVDHIEMLKGAASALYGDNAFLGVVNVVTKSAGQAPQVEASAEGGSYGTYKESLGIARTFGNGVGLYMEGSYRSMKGQDLYYPQFSAINNGVAVGSDREKNSTFIGKLDYAGFTLEGNVGNRTKYVPTASYGTRFNDPRTNTGDMRSFMELRSKHELTPTLALTSRLYYDWMDTNNVFMYDNAASPPVAVPNLDFASARSYGEEIRARLTPWGESNALTLGQEYVKTVRSRQQNYNEGELPYLIDVNATPYHWATYAQQEWQPYSKLLVTLGGRYDYYETFGETINPRIALVHSLWRDSVFKMLYGSAFRAPNPFEMFYGNTLLFVPNSGLNPERIKSYELIWEQQFMSRGMVRVSGYENMVDNLIQEVTLLDSRIQFQNVSATKSIGLEIYGKWAWNKSLSGFGGYNLQRTREINGTPLSNSPRHTASAGVSAWIEPTRTTVSLSSLFVGTRRTLQETTLPATAVFSFTLREQPWKAGPTFYASIYNLLDTNYSVSGASEHVQDAIAQDGRHFIAGLEYTFR